MLTVHRTSRRFPSVRLPVSLSIRSISQSISLSVCLPVPHQARPGASLCRGGAYRPQNKQVSQSLTVHLSLCLSSQSVNQSVCLSVCLCLTRRDQKQVCVEVVLTVHRTSRRFPMSVRLPVSLSIRSISLFVCLHVPHLARPGTSLCRGGAYRLQNKRRVSPLCEGVGASWAVRSGRTLYCTLGSRMRMDVHLQPKSPILVLCQPLFYRQNQFHRHSLVLAS